MTALKLSERLKNARLEHGITQKTLSEKVGVSSTTISNYERGRSEPETDVLAKIAQVLEIPATELIFDTIPNRYPKDLDDILCQYIKLQHKLDYEYSEGINCIMECKNVYSSENNPLSINVEHNLLTQRDPTPTNNEPDWEFVYCRSEPRLSEHPNVIDYLLETIAYDTVEDYAKLSLVFDNADIRNAFYKCLQQSPDKKLAHIRPDFILINKKFGTIINIKPFE